ncbi:glycosyltransferase [Paenibacillus rhizophilus]|uniref:4,4'-diaponeurosporenoate glycosyltransferase n=1 Tax=Paenibacillus rhizophilus TaxID=1850366 RepID=A0A3N9P7C7_9BACL|nr:glycosyltransferase [Paenibacillus rhizophilus]RQW11709.1 glycosyltransferase [Paenibacillus rhizophilus]
METMFTGPEEETEEILFSVLIPAHNEEKYIAKCLDSIAAASENCVGRVEVILILNRCTDKTEEIASSYNCVIVHDDRKNLSQIRNSGAAAARGEIVVTIDADSRMTANMLSEIEWLLSTGKYIGGGTTGRFERMSLGIVVSALALLVPMAIKYGAISVGIFWCRKSDFDAIGGFNEDMLMSEDADFARRLKTHGKRCGKKYGTLTKAYMITSCRKFDREGDWFLVKHPKLILAYLKGTDLRHADQAYYENQGR